jgi:hypothetical protein
MPIDNLITLLFGNVNNKNTAPREIIWFDDPGC